MVLHTDILPVSYTHLDVYKRQGQSPNKGVKEEEEDLLNCNQRH